MVYWVIIVYGVAVGIDNSNCLFVAAYAVFVIIIIYFIVYCVVVGRGGVWFVIIGVLNGVVLSRNLVRSSM